MREGAVVAGVAAELRQRDEHLARIGDVARRARGRAAPRPPPSGPRGRRSRASAIASSARRRFAGRRRGRAMRAAVHAVAFSRSRSASVRAVPLVEQRARTRVATASPGTAPDPRAYRCRARCAAARTTRGSMPCALRGCEMRKEAVVAEAQRHRVGGRAQHRVGAELVARRHDREGRRRRRARRDRWRMSSGSTSGMSPGTVSMSSARAPASAPPRHDRAGVSVAGAVGSMTSRAVAARRARRRPDRPSPPAMPASSRRPPASAARPRTWRAQAARRCAAVSTPARRCLALRRVLDRHHGADVCGAAFMRRPSRARRRLRARRAPDASRSSSVRISVCAIVTGMPSSAGARGVRMIEHIAVEQIAVAPRHRRGARRQCQARPSSWRSGP